MQTSLAEIHKGYCKVLLSERTRAGISRTELAAKIHIPILHLHAIEVGALSPSGHIYYSALKHLGQTALENASQYHLDASIKRLSIRRKATSSVPIQNFDALGVAFGINMAA